MDRFRVFSAYKHFDLLPSDFSANPKRGVFKADCLIFFNAIFSFLLSPNYFRRFKEKMKKGKEFDGKKKFNLKEGGGIIEMHNIYP